MSMCWCTEGNCYTLLYEVPLIIGIDVVVVLRVVVLNGLDVVGPMLVFNSVMNVVKVSRDVPRDVGVVFMDKVNKVVAREPIIATKRINKQWKHHTYLIFCPCIFTQSLSTCRNIFLYRQNYNLRYMF